MKTIAHGGNLTYSGRIKVGMCNIQTAEEEEGGWWTDGRSTGVMDDLVVAQPEVGSRSLESSKPPLHVEMGPKHMSCIQVCVGTVVTTVLITEEPPGRKGMSHILVAHRSAGGI